MDTEPVAVCISDIHFSLSTLDLATSALRQAMLHAYSLNVPLVIAGDLTDSKAIIRAEVANRLIEIFNCDEDERPSRILIIVGNHDLVTEKSKEHALNFLRPYADIIQSPIWDDQLKSYLIPYISDSEELQRYLNTLEPNARLIMHQGVQSAHMGHYVQDKSSLPREAFANFRVISGHYHRAQNIKCGRPRKGAVGLFSYIGSPYTTSFAEAEDGPKGFQVLYENGHLQQVETNLRKHVVINIKWDESIAANLNLKDLLWLKITGPYTELQKLKKSLIAQKLGRSNFKLDLIPTDSSKIEPNEQMKLSEAELLDKLIDLTEEPKTTKTKLKELWREVVE